MQFKPRSERRWQERRGEDEQPPLPEGGMMLFFKGRERETTKCAVGLLLIFFPSLPPFPACLQHMSPPLVAMATAPHVADRRRKRRGRGVEDKRVKTGWKEKGGGENEKRARQEWWGKEAKEQDEAGRKGGEKSRTFLFTSHSDSRCFLKYFFFPSN